MAVKDWPLPLRRIIGWILAITAATVIAGTTWLLLVPLVSGRFLELGATPWSIVLAHYSIFITAPVAVACAVAASRHFWRKGDQKFVLHLVTGAAIGIGVGLLLIPATGGFSLVSAPPFAGWAMIVAWLIRHPDRDATPNPPTSTP